MTADLRALRPVLTTPAPTVGHVRIVKWRTGFRPVRTKCTCGWAGGWKSHRESAVAQYDAHLASQVGGTSRPTGSTP